MHVDEAGLATFLPTFYFQMVIFYGSLSMVPQKGQHKQKNENANKKEHITKQKKKMKTNKVLITKQKRKHFKVVYLQINNFRQISIFSFKVMIQMESRKLNRTHWKR